tara:strand:+ start:8934 stop:10094 length:1161 start_codon:yes stop_codon:yes gene_type:complete
MKKRIAILGSTGSIGKTTINIIKQNKKKYTVIILSTYKNVNLLLIQAKLLNVKNVIIFNKEELIKNKNKFKKKKINVFPNFNEAISKFKKKIDITVCGISGLAGLRPLISSVEKSKKIAVANKESIICGWPIIQRKLKKFKTKLIPIDSEHFSVWKLIQNVKIKDIDQIILTASGGPFLNKKYSDVKRIEPKYALKHPNWKMGKKITIDSATMMNKVFEVIEAKKLFNIDIKKIKILIHPSSYIHAMVKFKNGTIKMLAHDTDMQIPIANAINENFNYFGDNEIIDLKKINNLKFFKPNVKQFPSLKFLNNIKNHDSFLEIVLIAANDDLVNYYLNRKINYCDIINILNKLLKMQLFRENNNLKLRTLEDIYKIVDIVKSKIKKLL